MQRFQVSLKKSQTDTVIP